MYMIAVCGSYLFACGKTSSMQLSQNIAHRIGGNLKLSRESTNADRKWLKIVFSIAICHLDCQFAI